jgi:hypothetical protein
MSRRSIPTKDRLLATGIDRLSKACGEVPLLGKLVMGDIRTRWHATNTRSGDVGAWRQLDGVEGSGNRPATYTHAGVLATAKQELLNRAAEQNALPAVAYTVGEAVMAAAIPGIDPNSVDRDSLEPWQPLQVGMRLGRDALRLTIGVYDPQANTFEAADWVNFVDPQVPIGEVATLYPNAHLL